MGFGGFYRDSNVGVNSPKAQLIIYCLQHELWQNASLMQWVKSANSRKRVEQYFLGEFEI
jgi:hypothetical protein